MFTVQVQEKEGLELASHKGPSCSTVVIDLCDDGGDDDIIYGGTENIESIKTEPEEFELERSDEEKSDVGKNDIENLEKSDEKISDEEKNDLEDLEKSDKERSDEEENDIGGIEKSDEEKSDVEENYIEDHYARQYYNENSDADEIYEDICEDERSDEDINNNKSERKKSVKNSGNYSL